MSSSDLSKYQIKSITPVDHYVCSLSEETQKRAFEEFGETEERRQKYIKEIRDWVLNNPRIEKCRLDSKNILRYLRHHNYDMDCVKESFERALILRQHYDFFGNLDYQQPNMEKLIDDGLIMVLPGYSKTGERVICCKASSADTNIPNLANTGLCLATQVFEILLEDEENQVRGFHYIGDISGVTLKHYFLKPFLTWFKILKNCERTYSGRHRGAHVLNLPGPLLFIVKIAFKHMHPRMREGIKFYSNLDELEIIDKDELPESMGGKVSLKSLAEPLKKKLEKFRPFLLNYNNQKVNLESYIPAVANCEVKTLAHRLENPSAKLIKK
ncbi:hypothetical protein PVAND_009880 [Polypedilum vanderplanki]|uniref:CRAL-TRIO domain-containing protein n=1 Tax=Polypedilum vanderplanki TaxID=319348 RepID=A0A9J6CF19_POLVA|nr:hypothetical protein PVAND_009880 [Polypedilum vanderplanki]